MRKEKMEDWNKIDFPLRVVITAMGEQVPVHSHDFIELVIFSGGNATHSISHRDKKMHYSVMQGDCFTVLPKEKHSFEDGNQAYYYNIIFTPELMSNELDALKEFETWNALFGTQDFNERLKVRLGLHDRMLIDGYINRLMNELDKRQPGYKICARAILLEILLVILRRSPQKMLFTRTPVKFNAAIMQIINEMEKNPEKHYMLSDMAKKANMCVSGFTKKFRNMIGLSPTEYLITLRMEKAEQLLFSSSMTVYDIAEQCGFYDINYFIKVFRRFYNTTPSKLRRNRQ